MRRRWLPVLLALAPLLLAACSTAIPASGGSGAQATPPTQGQKAPPAPAGKTVLFTDPAVRETARYQTYGPKGWESIFEYVAEQWILFSLPDGAQRIEIKAPFKGFRSCNVWPPLHFSVSFTGKDGLLMKRVIPDGLKSVAFSRTQSKWRNGNLMTDPQEVGFVATGLAETCVAKWLEPGETIAVVTGNGFDSFYVPLGIDLPPWQQRFVLGFYWQRDQAGSKYYQMRVSPDSVDWSPLPDLDAAFQAMEKIQPSVEN